MFVCVFVCLNVAKSLLVQFCLILMKLGTNGLCTVTLKTVEQILEILIFKFLANFLNLIFCQPLNTSSGAVWADRPRLLYLSSYLVITPAKEVMMLLQSVCWSVSL